MTVILNATPRPPPGQDTRPPPVGLRGPAALSPPAHPRSNPNPPSGPPPPHGVPNPLKGLTNPASKPHFHSLSRGPRRPPPTAVEVAFRSSRDGYGPLK